MCLVGWLVFTRQIDRQTDREKDRDRERERDCRLSLSLCPPPSLSAPPRPPPSVFPSAPFPPPPSPPPSLFSSFGSPTRLQTQQMSSQILHACRRSEAAANEVSSTAPSLGLHVHSPLQPSGHPTLATTQCLCRRVRTRGQHCATTKESICTGEKQHC